MVAETSTIVNKDCVLINFSDGFLRFTDCKDSNKTERNHRRMMRV